MRINNQNRRQGEIRMKIGNKYFCDDCEIETNKHNSYGLTNICDNCEDHSYIKPQKVHGEESE